LVGSEELPAEISRELKAYQDVSGERSSVIAQKGKPVELINAAMKTRPKGSNVLLLDSRVLVNPRSVRTMADVLAADEMVGFAAPRSNVPTVAQLPLLEELEQLDKGEAESAVDRLSRLLPEMHFVPAPPCDCLLIRSEILDEFGDLNSERVYGAELDLVLRANRGGYGAVLANQAYAWRADPADARREWLAALEEIDSAYPELRKHVDAYSSGPLYEADRVLSGFVPEEGGRRRVLFDFSSLAPYHNGTFEAACRILESAAPQWRSRFQIYTMCSPEAIRFHRLDKIPGVQFVPAGYERPCAAAFRFGQPFTAEHVRSMARAAPVNVWAMLDSIAWDCMYLRRAGLEEIWAGALEYGDAVIYISESARTQFHKRFRVRHGCYEKVIHLSLDTRDYPGTETAGKRGNFLLVVGNSFAHKRVVETAAALAEAFPEMPIVCLGGNGGNYSNVRFYESGQLSDSLVDDLFREASAVIFPSLHEGFGLPILRGLAARTPVIARSIPSTREVAAQLNYPDNLILYSTTSELIELLRPGIPAWRAETILNDHNWDAVAGQIGAVIEHVLQEAERCAWYEEILVPRIRYSQGGFSDKETADRVKELENSLSWRITRPLRKMADVCFGLRKRGSGVPRKSVPGRS
jgi:glycosyltransferase involved in cell wall biosynthesis